jgi:hypothetical protein
LVDEDLTRADGVIVCREITEAEMLQMGWRVVKLIKLLRLLPLPL